MKNYQNPIKRQGDFADPFVMRYNGSYYLYATNPDIRCWSSKDLLEWKAEGSVIGNDTFPGLVPFAPEIVYSNGKFYLYTSPSGLGHYVLSGDSPTGPFYKITGNIGHNIDGSVLIDDDGQWYFYWADDAGILCCKMAAPAQFGEAVNTGAFLNGWTEGPMVVKADGLYYMTYTGNHYLSPGYRVNVAVSTHPFGPFHDCENNPILVHTTGANYGLGHSSTVLGPDLATRYIVYHNMNPDLTRDLNIDAIELKQGRVQVAGPTTSPQPAPAMPAWRLDPAEENFEKAWQLTRGTWEKAGDSYISREDMFACVSNIVLPEQGALECNLIMAADCCGIVLGKYRLQFDLRRKAVDLLCAPHQLAATVSLPAGYIPQALHCVFLRYNASSMGFYLDGQRMCTAAANGLGSHPLELFAQNGQLGVGCVTISDAVPDAVSLCHPIPCEVWAEETISLNVPADGNYTLTVLAMQICDEDNAVIWERGGKQGVCLPVQKSSDCATYMLSLPKGMCLLHLHVGTGVCRPKKFFFHCDAAAVKTQVYRPNLPAEYGKMTLDMPEVCSCRAALSLETSADISGAQAGLLFRATELANGGEGNDARLGANFLIGYCASLTDGFLVLTKHRYDCLELARVHVGACKRIMVCAILNDIQIFVDAAETPAICFHDANPILYGRIGVRTVNCTLRQMCIRIN